MREPGGARFVGAATPEPATPTLPAPLTRPYFIPEAVDYEASPEPVRRELVNIVGPAYQEPVERTRSALQRSGRRDAAPIAKSR